MKFSRTSCSIGRTSLQYDCFIVYTRKGMKRMRKAVAALLAGAMFLTAVSGDFVVLGEANEIVATGNCGSGLLWTLYGSGRMTISGSGKMDTFSTSSVAPWNDHKSSITSVIVEEGVTSVGNYAFYGYANLASVVFPETLTSIGNYAFYQCSGLTGNLIIPASVASIGEYTFYQCTGLDGSLIFESSDTVQKTIGRYAFEYCKKLTGLNLGYGITEIGPNAFGYCDGITGNLVLPESLTTLGNNAFYRCKGFTGNMVLPDSLTSLGTYVFYECSGFDGTLVLSDGLRSIPQMAFGYGSGITGKLVIPDSMTSVSAPMRS